MLDPHRKFKVFMVACHETTCENLLRLLVVHGEVKKKNLKKRESFSLISWDELMALGSVDNSCNLPHLLLGYMIRESQPMKRAK